MQYLLYYIYLSDAYTLSDGTNTLYIIAMLFFSIGFLWTFIIPSKHKNDIGNKNFEVASEHFKRIRMPFLFLGLLGLIIGAVSAVKFGLIGPGDFFFNLRYSNTITGENTGGVAAYLLLFLQVTIMASIVFSKSWNVKTINVLILVGLLLSSAAFTMSRTSLLMALVSVLGTYIYSNKYIYHLRINKILILFSIGVFAVLTYLFAVGTKKDNGGLDFFFNYVTYPLVTFDKWILDFSSNSEGSLTFSLIYKILNVIGLIDYTPQTISNYIGVPSGQFNTFTYMGAPYLDFGTAGLLLIMLSLGIVLGFSYKQVRLGNPYWIIFSSIMLYPLIMSFFEYQFNLSVYIYYTMILIFVYFRSNINSRKSRSSV